MCDNVTGNMYSYNIMKRICGKSDYDLKTGTDCIFLDNKEISFDQVGIAARIEKRHGDKYFITIPKSVSYDLEDNSLDFIVCEIDNRISYLLA